MGQRSGQGTLLAVLMLGIGMALFSWVASSSLEQRRVDSELLIRKLDIKNFERRLDQAFRSPNFLRENFVMANPGILEAIEKALRDTSEKGVQLQVSKLRILDFEGDTWLGYDDAKSASARLSRRFEACQGVENCPIISDVALNAQIQEGVGFLEISVTFSSELLRINPNQAGNVIKISVPANLHGVELRGSRLFCREGFKALLVSQSPGDFLCAIQ
jgi:hypothetical protein